MVKHIVMFKLKEFNSEEEKLNKMNDNYLNSEIFQELF